jgi:hypothetical protein
MLGTWDVERGMLGTWMLNVGCWERGMLGTWDGLVASSPGHPTFSMLRTWDGLGTRVLNVENMGWPGDEAMY